MSGSRPAPRGVCPTCGGRGYVRKPRSFLSLRTGEASTTLVSAPCPQCREEPGWQRGFDPPV
ncbi:hypothetical protein GCM10011581_39410 [Saccharopolyspora subtropica]|uniref:Uncharacterized protein n=1 Tax=Saccharopolyspora thermophila TaxID=89367 RepID=A0A917K2A1_9PSEU|nr:hypothetical protein GCM10011581_39410 [Saccharopolyspora subtropica]